MAELGSVVFYNLILRTFTFTFHIKSIFYFASVPVCEVDCVCFFCSFACGLISFTAAALSTERFHLVNRYKSCLATSGKLAAWAEKTHGVLTDLNCFSLGSM